MTHKIDSPIVGWDVTSKPAADIVQMHEKLSRPPALQGSTYKIKTPLSEHALYVTINDIVLNPDSEHELRRPFEVFINSKNMDHFQWIVALTRIISAVFRKGGDVTFLVEELHSVFDPRGGYFKKGGRFMPSLVAEIGDVLETHLRSIGILEDVPDAHTEQYLREKRTHFAEREHAESTAESTDVSSNSSADVPSDSPSEEETDFPATAGLCEKCLVKAVVYIDGCKTCMSCGASNCS